MRQQESKDLGKNINCIRNFDLYESYFPHLENKTMIVI